jgi:addiction module RelB/DinJ family antitoxin
MYISYMNTTLHINIDKDTKTKAAKLAAELGLDLSVIVRASLKNFIQTQVFHVEKSSVMTPYLESLIEQINLENDWSASKKMPKSLNSLLDSDQWK